MESNNQNNVKSLYKSWFIDYASYVILERAIPKIEDGLKPVQRRILHSMYEMHDDRFHKVANVIGNTMKYHPHGDAAIGDSLVNMGQKRSRRVFLREEYKSQSFAKSKSSSDSTVRSRSSP